MLVDAIWKFETFVHRKVVVALCRGHTRSAIALCGGHTKSVWNLLLHTTCLRKIMFLDLANIVDP
jgi:hypothetical protein